MFSRSRDVTADEIHIRLVVADRAGDRHAPFAMVIHESRELLGRIALGSIAVRLGIELHPTIENLTFVGSSSRSVGSGGRGRAAGRSE